MKKIIRILKILALVFIFMSLHQCAITSQKSNSVENESSIVGSWKQVEPISECPVYFSFTNRDTEYAWDQNYIMKGSCDYRRVKRVWTCFECVNTERYRDYRNVHYSINSNLIYFPYGNQDTIPEEVIEILFSSQTNLKLRIFNQSLKKYDTLTFNRIEQDSVPEGVQKCECEYRSD